ncbi:MAG: hypothetical protein OEY09_21150 [Gammaproteobacteria bacterium]|nr:hypothetical protein [Gammaproteobacteria bacterium]
MLQLVSRIISKIKTNGDYAYDELTNTVCYTGFMVYHIERRGYFSIQDDQGNTYFPINSKHFPKLLKDRLRVQFTLQCYPDVANFFGSGIPAKIIKLEKENS